MILALPAYNEERSLPALLLRCIPVAQALAAEGRRFKVVVVDDGSKDSTIATAEAFADRLAIEVVPHVVNQGLGAALRTCVASGLARVGDDDVVATMDADNTHDPGLLPAMWHHLESTPGDVVIASRYTPGGDEVGLTPLRKVLSRGASFLLTMTVPVKGARDYTCGFRVYRASTLRRAADQWKDKLIEESGFTCMAEILLKLGRGGARVLEWPLILRYDLKEGASKMKIMRTITRYFAMAWRVRTGPAYRVV
ncbi:MAG: glycosyltransferase family 2 protein [Candidatus Eisenbacteria bacterium]